MKFKVTIIFLFFAAYLMAQPNYSSFDMAEMTANWLNSQEIRKDGFKCWPRYSGTNYVSTGHASGSAGIGEFFLNFYKLTGDTIYLDKAEMAAKHVHYNYSSGNIYGPDYLDGTASGGRFFIKLYKATQKEKYLDYAEDVADLLIQDAIIDEDKKQCYWQPTAVSKTYTGIAHGATGIAYFFTELYQLKPEEDKYLDIVNMAVNWIDNYTVNMGDGKVGYKRLTSDAKVYNFWCGGTTGMMYFFEKAYEVTNDQKYVDKMKACADGLLYAAVDNGDEDIFWNKYFPSYYNSRYAAYCHGITSTAIALLKTWKMTQDQKYYDIAIKGLNTVQEMKTPYNDMEYYPHIEGYTYIETGYYTGQASVGRGYIEAYQLTDSTVYLDLAKEVKDVLLKMATIDGDKMYWDNYVFPGSTPDYEKHAYTSFYEGAAGIGQFLIDYSSEAGITADDETVKDVLPDQIEMSQNYPNPFFNETKISYKLPVSSEISLQITDISGKVIKEIKQGKQAAGEYTLTIQMGGQPEGIYFYSVNTANYKIIKKMMLIK